LLSIEAVILRIVDENNAEWNLQWIILGEAAMFRRMRHLMSGMHNT
jgi:hypothetical protein